MKKINNNNKKKNKKKKKKGEKSIVEFKIQLIFFYLVGHVLNLSS